MKLKTSTLKLMLHTCPLLERIKVAFWLIIGRPRGYRFNTAVFVEKYARIEGVEL
jgi:hypothetical protein